jgi:glycerophosphoryl diester phosphodiesterase
MSVSEMLAVCRSVDARYAHPCFRPIDVSLVDTFHRAGLLVMTPHTNDPAEALEFARIGVDVIASDDPRTLMSIADRST